MVHWSFDLVRWLLKDLNWKDLEVILLILLEAAHWGVEWHLEALGSKLLADLEIISKDIEVIHGLLGGGNI